MKYTPGLFAGPLSGHAGSTVAGHGRNGHYFRFRSVPVNPNTSGQAAQRAMFQTLSQTWRSLTTNQRTDWEALGAQWPRLNPLGTTYFLTGFQAYMAINRMNVWRGGAAVAAAPPYVDLTPLVLPATLVFDESAQSAILTFSGTIGVNDFLILEATSHISQGISFQGRSDYRALAILGAPASPTTFSAAYLAAFGAFSAGEKVFVRVRYLLASGFAGPPELINTIVVP